MSINILNKLAELIEQQRDELLTAWRTQVRQLPVAHALDVPTLNDHLPKLLDELALAFRNDTHETIAQTLVRDSSSAHGSQRVKDSFDIEEVVAEYNILRGCIHDLADRNSLNMQGRPFHVLNRVLDGAIGSAVQSFAVQKALEVQQRREEYLAFVAHDLRTPLSAISLAKEVLGKIISNSGTDTPQTSQMLKTLGRNVHHLEILVNKVLEENINLETEQGMKLERRELDLWPLVEALTHDLHPVAGTASTSLINNIPEDMSVYADASLLQRIFQNLIANAIHYTPQGEIIISAEEKEDAIECFVRDNGKGIEPERCQNIFNKHETDYEQDGGLGLGLSIVLTFVEAHGGIVSVESELGVGSTFRFTLPHRVPLK